MLRWLLLPLLVLSALSPALAQVSQVFPGDPSRNPNAILQPSMEQKPGWPAPGQPPGWPAPYQAPGWPAPYQPPGWPAPGQAPGWSAPFTPPGNPGGGTPFAPSYERRPMPEFDGKPIGRDCLLVC